MNGDKNQETYSLVYVFIGVYLRPFLGSRPFAIRPPPFTIFSSPFGRLRIPLPLAHARDGHVREHARLLERIRIGESLGLGPAADVDDQKAADDFLAVVAERRAGDDQDVLLAVEVVEVRLQTLLALGCEVRRGDS